MSVIETLITDRRQSDVGVNAKGSYNASDLNRVGEACAYLYAALTLYGSGVPGYTALRTDWTQTDVPTAADMNAYLSSVAALKSVFQTAIELPDTLSRLTVEGANNIERVLYATDDLIHRMVFAMHQIGEFEAYSGSQFVPTMGTDYGRTWAELDAMDTTWANWNAADWYLLLYGNLKAEA